jgi:hypothetical protein
MKKKKGTWGGRRVGAGRKPSGNPKVPHRARGLHDARRPVLVTFKRAEGVPSLRGQRRLVRECIGETAVDGFHVVLFAVAAARVDFVVEADDAAALRRGLRSLTIRIARRINAALGHHGHVWGERCATRPLSTSHELTDAVEQVLGATLERDEAPRTALLRKLEKGR